VPAGLVAGSDRIFLKDLIVFSAGFVYIYMDESLLDQLFQRYIDKSATEAEKQAFLKMITDPSMASQLAKLSERYPVPFEELHRMNETAAGQILETILSMTSERTAGYGEEDGEKISPSVEDRAEKSRRRSGVSVFKMPWFKYAAAAILLVALTIYLRFDQVEQVEKEHRVPESAVAAAPVIGPGAEGAILTLSDGTQVELDSLENGRIVMQNGAWVSLRDGQLAYDSVGGPVGGIAYNTMTTPGYRRAT